VKTFPEDSKSRVRSRTNKGLSKGIFELFVDAYISFVWLAASDSVNVYAGGNIRTVDQSWQVIKIEISN
jgi:hypothetical protein